MTSLHHAITVLLVEDQDALRAITCRILEREGFRVLTAEDGGVALEVLDHYGKEVNVLLSDVAMPDMDGITLAQHVRTRFPDIKVILMSGYCVAALEEFGATPWLDTIMLKPFTADALVAAVRKAA